MATLDEVMEAIQKGRKEVQEEIVAVKLQVAALQLAAQQLTALKESLLTEEKVNKIVLDAVKGIPIVKEVDDLREKLTQTEERISTGVKIGVGVAGGIVFATYGQMSGIAIALAGAVGGAAGFLLLSLFGPAALDWFDEWWETRHERREEARLRRAQKQKTVKISA